MANEFSQAVNDITWFSRRIEGILNILPTLERIGSLDQAIAEKERILSSQTDLIKQAEGRLAELTSSSQKLKEELKTLAENASLEAKAIVSNAKVAAEQFRVKANETAVKIVAKAEDTAAKTFEKVAETQAKLDKVSDLLASRQQQLISVEDNLRKIKETVGG